MRILTDLKNDGVGVVVSTHDLVLAREVCEQVALLAGRQIAFGPRQEILVPRLVEEAYRSSGSDRLLDLGNTLVFAMKCDWKIVRVRCRLFKLKIV